MLIAPSILNRAFVYKNIEFEFLKIEAKTNLQSSNSFRGIAEVKTTVDGSIDADVYSIFLTDDELVIDFDKINLILPIEIFYLEKYFYINEEGKYIIVSCYKEDCYCCGEDVVVLNGGLVSSCLSHIEELFFVSNENNHLCSVCKERKSEIFFSDANLKERIDLCSFDFEELEFDELFHSIKKTTC